MRRTRAGWKEKTREGAKERKGKGGQPASQYIMALQEFYSFGSPVLFSHILFVACSLEGSIYQLAFSRLSRSCSCSFDLSLFLTGLVFFSLLACAPLQDSSWGGLV